MPAFGFYHHQTIAVGANATVTFVVRATGNEKYTVHSIIQKSTADFSIVGLRNSDGNSYSNASDADGIDGDFLTEETTDQRERMRFILPLTIRDNQTLFIDVRDNSGSTNTISLLLNCTKEFVS